MARIVLFPDFARAVAGGVLAIVVGWGGAGLLQESTAQAQSYFDPGTARPDAAAIRVQITPRHSTILSSQIASRIAELTLREGDSFAQGAVLVAFDCALPRARLAKAVASRDAARQTASVKRRLQHLNSVGLLEVELALAEVAQAEAEVAAGTVLVDYCQIVAPFSGRVAELKARPHQFVAEGDPLMEILDDSELEAEMVVPSAWLHDLRPGVRLKLHIEEAQKDVDAEVTRLAARIDPVSQSIKVFARLRNPPSVLLAGMSGTLLLPPPDEKRLPENPSPSTEMPKK